MKYISLFIALFILTSCHNSKRDYYLHKWDDYCDCAFLYTKANDGILYSKERIRYSDRMQALADSCRSNAIKYRDSLNQFQ